MKKKPEEQLKALGGGTKTEVAQRPQPVTQQATDMTQQRVTAYKQPIGTEQIQKANKTLQDYKQGKANLEARIIANEQWWKLRHWDTLRAKNKAIDDPEPTSAWLFNCLMNKHADAMDNYPEPNILPREEGDKNEAERLTSIVPVVLDQNDFEETYDACWHDKIRGGTGIYGVFWNQSKLNGLGDVEIKEVDILSLFWEPGITDIQKSANVFHTELVNNDMLESKYPQLKGKLSTATTAVSHYIYDDSVPTADKSVVVDWYYKRCVNGRDVLHYCKYCNDTVLFATENEKDYAERGWYDHGKYPFEFDVCFTEKGTPAGFGYIDVCKDPQKYIDLLDKAIIKNALFASVPRFLESGESGINEEEFFDLSKPVVHVEGTLDQSRFQQMVVSPLNDIYVAVANNKIQEMKETSGNRDVSNGGTTSGATAASAIAAMQEAGSKLSRDMIKASYRAYKNVVLMTIELIRQFYDAPRSFRITGTQGQQEFVQYSNAGIQPQSQGMDFGMDMGYRIPLFDVEVSAQKSSPYSKMSQNEMALQFYGNGFFNPQLADQALATLDMMDFDRKQQVVNRIQQNGTMMQQIMMQQQQIAQLSAMVDKAYGTNLSGQMQAEQGAAMGQAMPQGTNTNMAHMETNSLGADMESGNGVVDKARRRVAESTQPR